MDECIPVMAEKTKESYERDICDLTHTNEALRKEVLHLQSEIAMLKECIVRMSIGRYIDNELGR